MRARPRAALKGRGGAEHAGVEELEEAPQLAQVVLDRRAAEREAMVGLEQAGGLGGLGGGVLDRLRFVEDDVVEGVSLQARRRRGAACRRW